MKARIVVVADTHVGSIYGLCPKKFFNKFTTTPFQRWVIEKWEEFISYCGKPEYLVLNGDIVDGPGKKDSTTLIENDIHKQAAMAVELLSPLVGRHTEVYGVSGSGYHRGKGTGFDGDQLVTEAILGKFNSKGSHNRMYFGLKLEEYGIGNILFHHKGKSEKTEIQNIFEIYFKEGLRISMLVSSHLHRATGAAHFGSVTVLHTPCWECPTDFMDFGSPVDIGGLIIELDSRKRNPIHPIPESCHIPLEVQLEMKNFISITGPRRKQLEYLEASRVKEMEARIFKSLNSEVSKAKVKEIVELVRAEDVQLITDMEEYKKLPN